MPFGKSRPVQCQTFFSFKREKRGATEKMRMIFLSRRMAFVRKQDLSQGTILYTLHPVRFVFQTWLNQNKLGKLLFPSRSSFSNTARRIYVYLERLFEGRAVFEMKPEAVARWRWRSEFLNSWYSNASVAWEFS